MTLRVCHYCIRKVKGADPQDNFKAVKKALYSEKYFCLKMLIQVFEKKFDKNISVRKSIKLILNK